MPLIDGQSQLAGAQRLATVLHHHVSESGVEFDLDLTRAYDVAGLRSLVRRFRWQRHGVLELTDEVVADRELTLDEHFISRCPPALDDGRVVWVGRMSLEHNGFQPTVETIETADHHGRPETVYRLRLHGTAPAGHSAHRCVFTLSACWSPAR